MAFTSSVFLLLFLPVCVGVNLLLKAKYRNAFVLVMSCAFYAWCGLDFFFLLLGTATVAWLWGLALGSVQDGRGRRAVFVLALAFHLGVLFFYKYFFDLLGFVLRIAVNPSVKMHPLALPLGISFYTFSILSYLIDVFWRNCQPQRNLFRLWLYILLFPKVVQGPILQYGEFETQLAGRTVGAEQLNSGLELFIIGLAKKVLIANNLQGFVSYSFEHIARVGTIPAWLGIIAYLLQLYYDFSGYSDMAIGTGRMLGFDLPRNFDYPYLSQTVQEYWRRWHISLGEWFKVYLYMPLMKTFAEKPWISRFKNPMFAADIFALFITWVLTGIWHGSGVQFIIYGLWWFVFIAWERLRDQHRRKVRKARGLPVKKDTRAQVVGDHIITIFAIIFEQVNFRAAGPGVALSYWHRMLSLDARDGLVFLEEFTNTAIFALVAGLVFCFPVFRIFREKVAARNAATLAVYRTALVVLFAVLYVFVANTDYSPFLYQVF